MIDVVHVIGGLIAGGAESFVVNLAIALSGKCNVTILALSNRTDNVSEDRLNQLVDNGVKVEIGPTLRVGLKTIVWYGEIINKLNPHCIHLHTPNTELVHYLSFQKYPVFRTIHSTNLVTSWIFSHAIKRNKAIYSIACGEAVLEKMNQYGLFDNNVLISNGVDFSWPVSSRGLKMAARQNLAITADGFHYVSVGRMSAKRLNELPKAQDVLILAWSKFSKNKKNVYLHLIGDGNLSPELKEQAKHDSSIIFHGVQSNISEWLIAADFFVMPSRFEGLPIAGIEAVGTGLGCIFSDIEPLRQLNPPVVHWVEVDDSVSLTQAFESSSNTQQKSIDEHDVMSFRHEYSISSSAEKYYQLYLEA